MAERAILGVFVGGASRRMGGRPKGLLRAPGGGGETLVERLVAAGHAAGLAPVLVGAAEAYEGVVTGVPRIADAPEGVGPVGGLNALVAHAGDADAVAVACDMPHVTAEVLRALVARPCAADVLAARRDGRWEPMLARYHSPRVRPAVEAALRDGVRSFQRVFERLSVEPLPLDGAIERALADWDWPEAVDPR